VSMDSASTSTTYVLKFGSFFLVHEGVEPGSLGEAESGDLARRTHRVLVDAARSSDLVTRIVDDGIAEECWCFRIEDDGRQGAAPGLLGPVVLEVNWPADNWSATSTTTLPERLIIAVNGVTYAVIGAIAGEPPFEEAFEMGRQAQACLKSIYGEVAGCFTHLMGPTPMWPTVYFVASVHKRQREIALVQDKEVAVGLGMWDAQHSQALLIEAINQADWAIVEHYGAMEARSSFIQMDVAISGYIEECFKLHRRLSEVTGFRPARWFSRSAVRRELKRALSDLYEAHAEAAEIVHLLRRTARESHDSFSNVYFLAHAAGYTEEQVEDSTSWDDSHVLHAARFLEDDVRASSLEEVTLIAGFAGAALALIGAVVGAIIVALL